MSAVGSESQALGVVRRLAEEPPSMGGEAVRCSATRYEQGKGKVASREALRVSLLEQPPVCTWSIDSHSLVFIRTMFAVFQ